MNRHKHSTSFTVYPDNCNYMTAMDTNKPMVHGGFMLLKMDRVAAECVRRFMYDSPCSDTALTVNVKDVSFFVGASLGDIIFLDAVIVKTGIKSIDVLVTGWRDHNKDTMEKICEGTFRFVTFQNGRSVAHGLEVK